MPLRIGIPRALSYYAYYPLWKAFIEGLGHDTITSGVTTKQILDNGVREAVSDACIPIKLFHGHVYDLRDKVDFIFIPRLVSVNKERMVTFCPKFLGLPDMVQASMTELPPILDTRVDLRKGWGALFRTYYDLGKKLNAGLPRILRAYHLALKTWSKYNSLLNNSLTPVEAINVLAGGTCPERTTDFKLRFAVLGFPYTVNDCFLNVDLLNKLRKLGITVFTTEMVPHKKLLAQASQIPKNLFWNYGNQVLRAALYYLDQVKVDGVIHLTAFGCGPDAMVDKLVELEAKQRGNIPFMSITLDEQTGEAGLMTRLEAFVDMLALRRELA